MEVSGPVIGYIVCAPTADGSFLGGALIVDTAGLPVEFRHTEPLSPSRLQRVLYGRSLESYLYNEVVIGALLDSIESSPALLVAADTAYLSGVALHAAGAAAIWMAEARNVPAKEVGARQDLSDEEYVLYLGPGNGPVRIRLGLPPACDDSVAASTRQTSADLLLRVSRTMEVIEPLRRVDDALRMLAEEMLAVAEKAA